MANRIEIVLSAEGSEAVAKIFKDLSDKGKLFGDNLVSGGKQGEAALNSLGATAKRVFEIFTGVNLANIFTAMVSKVHDLAQESYQLGLQSVTAERALRGMLGVDTDRFLARMRAASDGLADISDAATAAARGIQQSLSQDQLVALMELARDRAKLMQTDVSTAFSLLADAIATQSTRALKQANIIVDAEQAYKRFAERIGTVPAALNEAGRSQAIYAEASRVANEQTKVQTTEMDKQIDAIKRNEIAWRDLKEELGAKLVEARAGAIGFFAEVRKQAGETADVIDAFARRLRNLPDRPVEGQAGGIGTSDIVRSRPAPVVDPNTYKTANAAVLEVEQSIKMLNATMGAGLASTTEYAAGLQDAISKLQALGASLDADGRLKLLGFQAALATIHFAKFQQDLAVSLQATQAWGSALISSVKESVAQKFTTVEEGAIAEANIRVAMLAADRARLAQAFVEFKGNEAQKFELEQKYATLAVQLAEAKSAARIAVWENELKQQEAILKGWVQVAEGIFAETELELKALEAITNKMLADEKTALDVSNAGWVAHADAVVAGTEAELQAMVQLNEPMRTYQDSLKSINVQSAVLGDRFDAVGAKISLMQSRLAELAKTSSGEVTPAMRALAAELEGLRQFSDLRDLFKGVFSSIGDSINTLVQGVILGTQTMAEAWSKLWRSIVLGLLNSGIQQAIKWLGDSIWGALFGGSSGLGGGGNIISTVVGGLSRLIGGSSAVSPAASATGTEFDALSTSVGTANTGLTLFGQSLSSTIKVLGGVAALGVSIYGLVSAIQAKSPLGIAAGAGGTALSAYGLASTLAPSFFTPLSQILVNALAAYTPTLLASINSVLGTSLAATTGATAGATAATAGASISSGIVSGLSTTLAWLANPGVVFGGMLLAGGLAGRSQDQEMAAQQQKKLTGQLQAAVGSIAAVTEQFDQLGSALQTANLPDTISKLQSAVRSLPDLAHAIGIGAAELAGMVPELRAKVGAQLVATLDAASRAGVDASSITASPVRFRAAEGESTNILRLRDMMTMQTTDVVLGGAMFQNTAKILEHLLQLSGEQGEALAQVLAVRIDERDPRALREDDPEGLWMRLMTPEHIAQIQATGPVGDVANFKLDPESINALLDREFLTVALRNAVVDVGAVFGLGAERFAERGLGGGTAWAMAPGESTQEGGGAFLPSVSEISAVQARLDEAGFKPGEYGKALEAFLVSIDANIVNSPAWAKFAAALEGAGTADQLTTVLSGVQFDALAETIVSGLYQTIGDTLKARATTTDPAAREAIDKTLEAMGQQLAAWNNGLSQLFTTATEVNAILPADVSAQMRTTLAPMFTDLLEVMRRGTAEQATQFAQAFQASLAGWAALGQSITQRMDVEALLPTDLGARFHAAMQPIYDEILASLVAGNTEIAALQLEQVNRQVAAWQSLAQIVGTIQQEIAARAPGDITAAMVVWGQLDRTVTRTGEAFHRALDSGDVDRIAAASAAYHDATLARLAFEQQYLAQLATAEEQFNAKRQAAIDKATAAIKETEAAIKQIADWVDQLNTLTTTLIQSVTKAAMIDIDQGDFGTVTTLLTVLGHVAVSASTAATRLWAVNQGLQVIIATLPGAIKLGGSMQTGAQWFGTGMQTSDQLRFGPAGPSQITGALIGAASPFLGALASEIEKATGGDKLALLQQQSTAFQSLADAAIGAVNQWAEQAIAGAQEAAQSAIDGLAAIKDAQLADIDKRIDKIQRAAAAEQELRQAQMQGLQEAIQKAKEWESAIESMDKFIQALKVGPVGPGNPADKLRIAQEQFAGALRAYNANPTAQGLGNLQGLAQTMLQLAEPIFSKPSPQFQNLSATTIKQLLAAEALAKGQATDSEILQSQLDALQSIDKAAGRGAQDQIDALNAQKAQITRDFEKQTKDIQAALKTQVDAIKQAAKDEIFGINTGLSLALKDNATAQAVLIGEGHTILDAQRTVQQNILTTQQATLAALSSTEFEGVRLGDIAVYQAKAQDKANGILGDILIALQSFQPGHAAGLPRVTTGLHFLHEGEMVVPKAMADQMRSFEGGAGMPDFSLGATIADIQATWADKSADEQAAIIAAYNAADAATQQAVQNTISYWNEATDEARIDARIKNERDVPFGYRYEDYWAMASRPAYTWAGGPPTMPPPTGPPTLPPPAAPPPYVPPGPGWLTRAGTLTDAGSVERMSTTAGGGGMTTIVIQLDGKTIGEATLPSVQLDARQGKLRKIIIETQPK